MAASTFLLVALVALCLLTLAPQVAAFGAGNIPSYGYLEGIASRHGDIEDTLAELFRKGGAGFLGIGGNKFGGLDIKRVYFGNWLRDYSQAMDVAGLSKLSRQAILNLVMALSFLASGYATSECKCGRSAAWSIADSYTVEITEERLGVYLPVEHIDNPKGYNDNKDARQVHPALRPPVDPVELEIDPRTGMKNYIANEQGHWDTSSACVRRTMQRCIDMGRRARSSGNENELYEAYRLLGQFLHTLEDLSAHSNWCELALQKLGHRQTYAHVGDNVRIRAPSGEMVAPLVTGTFGSSDFIHSLLGEAGDHISEASVSDLNKTLEKARSGPSDRSADGLRDMLFQIPGGSGNNLSREMDGVNNMNRGPGAKNPADMSPQELHAALWQVLTFRDNVVKTIERTIEKIPGLSSLVERITDSINKFVFTTLEPYLKPIMSTATGALQSGSAEVIDNQDQYEVFNNPNASDPTHSLLAKDHFGVILNEPAGELAKIVLRHAVNAVVKAWDDNSVNPQQAIQTALSAIHHPYFSDGSPVQREMMQYMEKWINTHRDRDYILRALTKEEVRAGRNKRKGHKDPPPVGAYQSFLPTPQALYGQASTAVSNQAHHAMQAVPGYSTYQNMMNRDGMPMPARDMGPSGYDGGAPQYGHGEAADYLGGGTSQQQRPSHTSYQPPQPGYGGPQPGYGGPGGFPEPAFGGPPPPQQHYGGHNDSYGPPGGGFPEPRFEGGPPGGHHGGGHHGHGPPRHDQGPPGFPQGPSGYGQQSGGGYGGQGGYDGRY